ncbi:hypothetical protein [Streptomyces capitiformicae]|uniref:hypothetical protein n=1 Tax=Streptomyces capitiformicae TaxID=2014920 RepID=UPI00167642B0|nr:hypothetical protein [Streptomyces capitiformicae]
MRTPDLDVVAVGGDDVALGGHDVATKTSRSWSEATPTWQGPVGNARQCTVA